MLRAERPHSLNFTLLTKLQKISLRQTKACTSAPDASQLKTRARRCDKQHHISSEALLEMSFLPTRKGLSWTAQGLEGDKGETLSRVRFVPVANATRLAAPCRLFVRLRQELSPFAFELPAEYNSYVTVLKEAGCRDSPTSQDLLDILKAGFVHFKTSLRPKP